MKRFSIALGLAVGLAAAIAACNGRNPTAPNPLPPPPAQPDTLSLAGQITEPVNVPVDGASVTIVDGPYKGKSSTTDSGGNYSLFGVEGTFTVQVSKSGYASWTQEIKVTQSTFVNFQIAPIVPHASVSGSWTVTFEPNPTCPDLTKADFRKYRASIVQQGAQLGVTLSGATFATPPQLAGAIHGPNVSIMLPGGCGYYCYGAPDVPTVIEAIAADQFLAISGVVTATAGPTSIAGTLSGEFTLTKNAKPPFDVLATCSNEQHRVTFTR